LAAGHVLGIVDLTVTLREARRQFEREYIAAVLGSHGWSVSDAARTLGIERANLYRKVRQVGLVLPSGERVARRRS
jgi:DNA-binding NtrC family response regulator